MAWLVLLVALVGVVAIRSMVKFLCLVLLFVLICDQKKILFKKKKKKKTHFQPFGSVKCTFGSFVAVSSILGRVSPSKTRKRHKKL